MLLVLCECVRQVKHAHMPDGMAETHIVGSLVHTADPGQSKSVVHASGDDAPLNKYATVPLASTLTLMAFASFFFVRSGPSGPGSGGSEKTSAQTAWTCGMEVRTPVALSRVTTRSDALALIIVVYIVTVR